MRGILYSFGDTFCAGKWNVESVTLVVVRGGSKIPSINTVGGTGVAVVRCLVDYNSGAERC